MAADALPFTASWNFDAIAQTDQLDYFATLPEGQDFAVKCDMILATLATLYFNHLDYPTPAEILRADDLQAVFWTFPKLLQAAAGGRDAHVVNPKLGDLSPEWNLKWLIQRQKAVNLLRFAPVKILAESVSGNVHTGEPSSPQEALQHAMRGAITGTTSVLGQWIEQIYGPDHGWREGSYCCNAEILSRVSAVLPQGMDGNAAMLVFDAQPIADGSFAASPAIQQGLNAFKADEQGVFLQLALASFQTGPIPWPTTDHVTYGGWKAARHVALADYSPIFHFK